MTRKQAEDIRWVAAEVTHLSVLLGSHGLGHLANRLNSVQQELQYVQRNGAGSPDKESTAGEIISLEKYRLRSANP